ncbi:MAG: Hint domain-containing protein [Pseudomonadota bacterium]
MRRIDLEFSTIAEDEWEFHMGYVASITARTKTNRRYLTGICGEANVRTPLGGRRIEMLNPGDMVVTRNNGLQPVRMIWSWTVTADEMRAHPELAPIRLKTRAIGPMMPGRDLRMASGHRVLIPGYRIAGSEDSQGCLMRVDGVAHNSDKAFAERTAEEVTYYNVVFDQHEVITAEGLPVESFLPSPKALNLLDVSAQQTLKELFPELSRRRCAYPGLSVPVARASAYLAQTA